MIKNLTPFIQDLEDQTIISKVLRRDVEYDKTVRPLPTKYIEN